MRADGCDDDVVFPTEQELEDRFVEVAQATAGAVVVFGSMQNLDRLVTVYRAARRSGRETVLDLYGATVAAATRPTIPQPGFTDLLVYLPRRQRGLVKQSREFWRTQQIRAQRIFPEELAEHPGRYLLHVPPSTAREFLDSRVLDTRGVAVWSLWEGYLAEPSGKALQEVLRAAQVRLVHLHTSGHASVPDLRRLVDAIAARHVVPIHSEAADRYAELFPNVARHTDGDMVGGHDMSLKEERTRSTPRSPPGWPVRPAEPYRRPAIPSRRGRPGSPTSKTRPENGS